MCVRSAQVKILFALIIGRLPTNAQHFFSKQWVAKANTRSCFNSGWLCSVSEWASEWGKATGAICCDFDICIVTIYSWKVFVFATWQMRIWLQLLDGLHFSNSTSIYHCQRSLHFFVALEISLTLSLPFTFTWLGFTLSLTSFYPSSSCPSCQSPFFLDFSFSNTSPFFLF